MWRALNPMVEWTGSTRHAPAGIVAVASAACVLTFALLCWN
jgi:hypothetical protein